MHRAPEFEHPRLLEMIGGDAGVFLEIAGLFVDSQPARLAGLQEAVASGEVDAAQATAHALRGAFASMSMPALALAAAEIERAAAAGDLDAMRAGLARLEPRFERALAELHAVEDEIKYKIKEEQ